MNKTWLVLKNEFFTTILRKSFILTLVLLPLTSFIILLVVSGIQKRSGVDATQVLNEMFIPGKQDVVEGYIDLTGMFTVIPEAYQKLLIGYDSENEAKQAVTDGKIAAYYILPPDYMETGNIYYVRPDFNPLGGSTSQSGALDAVIAHNLTDGDMNLTYRVQNPVNPNKIELESTGERDTDHPLTFLLPYIITFLFYIVILTSSSLLLNSISSEKQNRVMEILMTSVTPRQMLTGKIIALGLVGLIQTCVWLGAGLLMLRYSGRAFALSSAFQLPISILLWGILFFLLGYAVYASLMAGIGALVPNLREASQLTTVVIMHMIVPLMFISTLISTPHSPLSIVLSLFPLTSPVGMMTRLAAASVPLWQVGLSLVLLALTAFFLVQTSAGLFRAQNLLSGNSITTTGFLKALAGGRFTEKEG